MYMYVFDRLLQCKIPRHKTQTHAKPQTKNLFCAVCRWLVSSTYHFLDWGLKLGRCHIVFGFPFLSLGLISRRSSATPRHCSARICFQLLFQFQLAPNGLFLDRIVFVCAIYYTLKQAHCDTIYVYDTLHFMDEIQLYFYI